MVHYSAIMSFISIFLFFIILLVLVIVHEFGHFIVAKLVKMRVDEFAFGFPPRIFGKKIGETTYALNALPLGGYVSIWGENGEPDDEAKTHPRAFGNRPWWAQLSVLVAGVAMNMLLALFIFIGSSYGEIQVSVDDPIYGSRVENVDIVVVDVASDSPAFRAGIVPGVTILGLETFREKASLSTATSVIEFIGAHPNDPLTITYVTREGIVASTTIASVYGIVPEKKAIGVSLEGAGIVTTTVSEAITLGYQRTYNMTVMTLEGLGMLVTSIGKGDSVLESLSGPVGIARIVGETSEYGVAAIFTLVAVLSINLAIFNILPLPALDGGRIVIVLIETVIRKKIPFKYYSLANMIGFLLLMALLIVVTFNDVLHILR